MPSWTLGDLTSQATVALGNRSDIALSTVSFWVNEAGRVVWDALPHSLQESSLLTTTSVTTDRIVLPTNFYELVSISNISSTYPTLLEPVNIDQAEAGFATFQSGTSGTPTHYLLYNNQLELHPSPDSAYSMHLRYKTQWTDVTSAGSVPSVATRFRYGIMLKAVELLARHVVQDEAKAQLAQAEYVQYMTMTPSDRALRVREQHATGLSLGQTRGEVLRPSQASFDLRID